MNAQTSQEEENSYATGMRERIKRREIDRNDRYIMNFYCTIEEQAQTTFGPSSKYNLPPQEFTEIVAVAKNLQDKAIKFKAALEAEKIW